jgi:protein O-GlcNAc transferase
MSAQKIDQALNLAVSHHQAGRLADAEPLYRQILKTVPNHADALHLLGVLHGQTGRHDLAAELIRKAIAVSPRNPAYHSNLGFSLLHLGQFDAAANTYQQLLALDSRNADAHYHIGNVLWMKGAVQPAIASYQRALACNPQHVDTMNNLGNALVSAGQYDQAIALCSRAIVLNPLFPAAHNNMGNAFKAKGNLAQAIACYRQAILLDPNYADAHNNLGNALGANNECSLAIESYRKAIALNPTNAEFLSNLGSALVEMDQLDAAIQTLQQATRLDPNYPVAFYNLAVAYTENEQFEEAIACHEKALSLKPDYFDALLNVGVVYGENGQFKKGIQLLERALALRPASAEVHNNLGVLYNAKHDYDQAIACHERAIQLKPDNVESFHNLGNALKEKGELANAIRCYTHALTLDPNHFKVLFSLGMAWKEGANLDESISCLDRALALEPEDANTLAGLASAYQDAGQLDRAVGYYRQALAIDPKRMDTHGGLLYGLLYSADPQSVTAEHKRWNASHAKRFIDKAKPFNNTRDPERRIRLAYISGDFRHHSVNHFFQQLLEAHDKIAFELFGYANVPKPDAVTEHLKTNVIPNWRSIAGLEDDETADLIREDQIDILVELAGHSAYNSLLVMARKPAPVQVSYLGYAATTGLTAVDYRISDIYADPPGTNDSHCTETLVHLPQTAWVYMPPADATPVSPLPALSTGMLTFGSNNYFGKLSDTILSCWMQVLLAVPNSRLIIKAKGTTSKVSRGRIECFMSQYHLDTERVQLIDYIPAAEHFQHFSKIDIALDSYPYNGTTTTCETLWMGIPVITLVGEGHVSRVGYSLMTNIGLPQLTAQSVDQFVSIAQDLASDLPRLADLRSGMRQRMIDSPIMDPVNLARNIEALYRDMWKRWCQS